MERDRREQKIQELARRIAQLEGGASAGFFHLSYLDERVMGQALADPDFRSRLFRFVDAFPSLRSDSEITEHLQSEFRDAALPSWFGIGLSSAARISLADHVVAAAARRGISRMARQFIIGSTPAEVAQRAAELWSKGRGVTVDLLGEHTYSESEADRYAQRLEELVETLGLGAASWPPNSLLESDDLGPVPRASVSVKVSALSSSFAPLTGRDATRHVENRLFKVLQRASALGVSVWFDMEGYVTKDLTKQIFFRLLDRRELDGLHTGLVIQAYLKDAAQDLEELARWAKGRRVTPGVRLVKGAYWDTETVLASARNWPVPVFEVKEHTDANFEMLATRLHQLHDRLRVAFGSHNVRSLAAAIVDGRNAKVADNGYEIQLLYGMAEPVHEALCSLGMRVRVYAPMGELVPGMAYLVRRLLENTSNDSFVRHHFAEGQALEDMLRVPHSAPSEDLGSESGRRSLGRRLQRRHGSSTEPRQDELFSYEPESPAEWHRAEVMKAFEGAVEAQSTKKTRQVPGVIGGKEVQTKRTLASLDPADPSVVVANVAMCGNDEVEQAIRAAREAFESWSRTPVKERAEILFGAAEIMRRRRFEIAALQVLETSKGWGDADADVCEAIDYCEYYARQMLVLASRDTVQSPHGEDNSYLLKGRGICAVISPWNFPLAIPTGMTVAALVSGNTVVLKPAEQAPAVAFELVSALREAGLADGVLNFVPGLGEEAGAALVAHTEIDTVAFTGSRDVGLQMMETLHKRAPGRKTIPRVIAELGGKNAVIVDADADLDEVVPAVISSAFDYAGQKCSAASRLIALSSVYDAVVERVVEATRSLLVGPPRFAGTQVGPVIDADSHRRLRDAQGRAHQAGEVLLMRTDVAPHGYFVGPTIVGSVDPQSWLARDELFGPILAAFSVPDLQSAVDLANDSDYALTAGVFSRAADHVQMVTSALRAGNVYVNRPITGAVVGRQPFGGRAMSGVGHKAGGPDYLLQFCDSQVLAENTMRQGFVATAERPSRHRAPDRPR